MAGDEDRLERQVRSVGARAGVTLLAFALSGLGGCEPAPLGGKACGCAPPYVCCQSENLCLAPGEVCVGAGPWPIATPVPGPPPLPMEQFTVFAASQVPLNEQDEQLFALAPDMVLRGWSQWGIYGLTAREYADDGAFKYVDRCRDARIAFLGGVATTVLFEDQFTQADDRFADFATVDASGQLVTHDDFAIGEHRATLANPRFRQYLVDIAKLQIDGGVDGVNFDEVNETYQGQAFTGNEGFDDYNLADFNAYLMAKFPGDDLRGEPFLLPADNYLRPDVPARDLLHNFNYRRYLQKNQVADDPFAGQRFAGQRAPTAGNTLAAEWRGTISDRPDPAATSFVDQAVPYRYWRDIVEKVRAYAADKGRSIFVSAKGIYPLVDFQSVGLSDYPAPECPESDPTCYVPRVDGHLDGARTLQPAFQSLRAQSDKFAPGVPVVVYLDGLWQPYDDLTDDERRDYWRIYAAEAYANGLFFAFRLTAAHDKEHDPATATRGNVLALMVELATFYRDNQDIYHGVAPSPAGAQVTTSLTAGSVMIAVSDQAATSPSRRLVHLVNHNYAGGLLRQDDVTVEIPVTAPVTRVRVVSPDAPSLDVTPVAVPGEPGRISVILPSLLAYAVIIVSY